MMTALGTYGQTFMNLVKYINICTGVKLVKPRKPQSRLWTLTKWWGIEKCIDTVGQSGKTKAAGIRRPQILENNRNTGQKQGREQGIRSFILIGKVGQGTRAGTRFIVQARSQERKCHGLPATERPWQLRPCLILATELSDNVLVDYLGPAELYGINMFINGQSRN